MHNVDENEEKLDSLIKSCRGNLLLPSSSSDINATIKEEDHIEL
jgi:hypothetical protein